MLPGRAYVHRTTDPGEPARAGRPRTPGPTGPVAPEARLVPSRVGTESPRRAAGRDGTDDAGFRHRHRACRPGNRRIDRRTGTAWAKEWEGVEPEWSGRPRRRGSGDR
ncbi:hypothetical protein GCM10018781_03560 [Kitasatospora indigofera]|uniref:Uncharacterized protein n=1 Tax=Kitasatospora indigofera TaxID=67307 RepID=A0A919FBJ4_9ACTN|nr:hypothetical protein GCM10018781_03560 [Kitasatospora indigofera]